MFRSLTTTMCMAASVAAVLAPDTAYAQGKSILTGRVVDADSGAGLANAVVVATSNSLQGEQTVETDASGYYRLPHLPGGTFQVAVFAGGYRRYDVSGIALRGGVTVRIDAALVPEKAKEVDIVVSAPTIDVGSSGTSTHFDSEFIRAVPVIAPGGHGGLSRSFDAVARSAPGAEADTRGTSFGGATSAENGYQIDGMSVGSPRLGVVGSSLSAEFIDEIQVVDSGYMPEFGRSLGALVSATTRSGGNETHGGAWFSMSPGALSGEAPEVRADGEALAFSSKLAYRGDLGAHVGGALRKDKVWYFVGFQIAQNATRARRRLYAMDFSGDWDAPAGEARLLDGETREYLRRYTEMQAITKFTFNLGKDDSLVLAGLYIPQFDGSESALATDDNLVGLNASDTATHKISEQHTTDLTLHWLAARNNKRWNFDTALSWHFENGYQGPHGKPAIGSGADSLGLARGIWSPAGNRSYLEFEKVGGAAEEACEPHVESLSEQDEADGVSPRVYQPCPVRGYTSGGVGEVTDSRVQRVQLKHTTSFNFSAGGHHTLKAGVDVELIHFRNLKQTTGGSILVEQEWGVVEDTRRLGYLVAPNEARQLPYMETVTMSPQWGAFLQDSWNIADTVTLNAGLRYDGQMVWAADKVWVHAPLQLSPRIGLVWDPTKKGRAKLYANYARYYQGLTLEMAEINGSVEGKLIGAYDPAGCADARMSEVADACVDRDSAWDNDHEGANRSWGTWGATPTTVDPKLKAQAMDEWVAGAQWEFIPGVSAGVTYRKRTLVRAIEDMSRDEAASYFLGNPGFGIAQDFPKAQRDYDSVLFVLEKRMADNWMAQASYNLSWLRGNYAGLIKPEIDQLLPHITSDFDLKSLLVNRVGWLPGDHRHSIKLYAAGNIPMGKYFELSLGGAAEARSGAPTNYLGAHWLYGPHEAFLLPRGTGPRLPWTFNVNLTVQAVVKFNESTRLSIAAEAFNILNLKGVTGVDEEYTWDSRFAPNTKDGATKADLDAEVAEAAEEEGVEVSSLKNSNFGNANSHQDPTAFRLFVRMQF